LLQHTNDLLLRVPTLPHFWSSSGFYTPENSHLHWHSFRGAGQATINLEGLYQHFWRVPFDNLIEIPELPSEFFFNPKEK